MTRFGKRELLRRMWLIGFAALGAVLMSGDMIVGLLVLLLAILGYAFLPSERCAADAILYEKGPAIVGPDLLGLFLFTSLFGVGVFALASEGWAEGPHPAVFLLWPFSLAGLPMLYIGWRNASAHLRITPSDIIVVTGRQVTSLPIAEITRVTGWRRGLPGWVKALAPFLVMMGRPGPAGAVLLARDSNGLALHHGAETPVIIPTDGLETGRRKLLALFERRGIDLEV